VTTHHPLSAPPLALPAAADPTPATNGASARLTNGAGAPDQQPIVATENGLNADPPAPPASPSHAPLPTPDFQASVRELAQDLVAKQKQIEALVARLPDLSAAGGEEERQIARIAELEAQLGGLEGEVAGARERREALLERIEGVVAVVGRGRVGG